MKTRWYKNAVFYQIYPRSFKDANGDGIGDIRGIIEKIDYLRDLGINAVWLSPVYRSPNDDNGYDISDYRDINPEFGTLDDWKEMIVKMHENGIRLVMDLVVNHSSDEHQWFTESRKSKDNPYRDYYIWRPGKNNDGKKPPNNWTSRFGGSAWKYDQTTNEWYLHLFSEKQPDLNWANPKVRSEVVDICNYWFDLGIDGFRCDVITYISKADGLPDGKYNPIIRGDEHFVAEPKIHEYLHQLNVESWSKYDSMIVGEAAGLKLKDAELLIGESREEMDSVIEFELSLVDLKFNAIPVKLNLKKFKQIQSAWQNISSDCWNTLFYENHDQPRSISRYGNEFGPFKKELAKMLAISYLTLKGTPYIYQGQEIGMSNISLRPDEYADIMTKRIFQITKKFPPLYWLAKKVMKKIARDNARTPMQWNGTINAGFTTGTPWFKLNPNYGDVNVVESLKNPNSILNFYKKLLDFRRGNEIIINGSYKEYFPNNKSVYAFERVYNGKRYIVICNFKEGIVNLNCIDMNAMGAKLILSNYANTEETFKHGMTLRPYEAFIFYDEKQ
ncbi:MAG: alpha-glucosidase [Christensenellaceae bacterium]|jgi:oligo-1,6-glucosidase|nr:alpha-glucosidase [Christensenellaceae bacterium]